MKKTRRRRWFFNPACKGCAFHCQYTKQDMDEGIEMKDPKRDCPYFGKKSYAKVEGEVR